MVSLTSIGLIQEIKSGNGHGLLLPHFSISFCKTYFILGSIMVVEWSIHEHWVILRWAAVQRCELNPPWSELNVKPVRMGSFNLRVENMEYNLVIRNYWKAEWTPVSILWLLEEMIVFLSHVCRRVCKATINPSATCWTEFFLWVSWILARLCRILRMRNEN